MKFYDPQIYPVGLVLSRTGEEINRYYNGTEGAPIETSETAEERGAIATTYKLKRKTGDYYAVGIVFRRKPTVQTIAHEAFHAAHCIMQYIGEDFIYEGNNESWAYLVGWIAMKCEEFVAREFKKTE